jgi:hypothetical protein
MTPAFTVISLLNLFNIFAMAMPMKRESIDDQPSFPFDVLHKIMARLSRSDDLVAMALLDRWTAETYERYFAAAAFINKFGIHSIDKLQQFKMNDFEFGKAVINLMPRGHLSQLINNALYKKEWVTVAFMLDRDVDKSLLAYSIRRAKAYGPQNHLEYLWEFLGQ